MGLLLYQFVSNDLLRSIRYVFKALAGQQRALLLLVEIQCAQVEQNETKSQSPLTLIGKGRVYGNSFPFVSKKAFVKEKCFHNSLF